MAIQLNLFGDKSPEKKEQKKDKNRNAQWDKFYTLYMFDEIKYHRMVKEHIKANNFVTWQDIPQDELKRIKSECYVRDENGELQSLGDEKHIFRYQTLYKIYKEIAQIVTKRIEFPDSIIFTKEVEGKDLRVSVEYYNEGGKQCCERIAEIEGSGDLELKERVLLHAKLLRELRAKEAEKGLFEM